MHFVLNYAIYTVTCYTGIGSVLQFCHYLNEYQFVKLH